jgi:hypothetical protein
VQALGMVISLATVALGIALAVGLLRLGVRNRTAPELAMGLYCLLVSAGALLFGAAIRAAAEGSASADTLVSAYTLCIALAVCALAVGIWRIFRRGEAWGRALAAGAILWIGGAWIACNLSGHPALLSEPTPANLAFVAGRVAVYAFGAFEALRYAHMLRKRALLGLADPVSAHQIRLWGIAWLCAAGIAVGSVLGAWIGGHGALESPLFVLPLSMLNAAAWICTWLAFFPPRAYQGWVSGAAPASR